MIYLFQLQPKTWEKFSQFSSQPNYKNIKNRHTMADIDQKILSENTNGEAATPAVSGM